ncbi:MAG TPA: MFS transporter [Polyangiaceae bacterium]|nr:MFS transporter [Polyangiaceae bacterium]
MSTSSPSLRSERALIFIVGAIQFVNVLDFMIVMPLGPDFASALGIDTSHIGLVGGSYTAAAAVAGVVGSLYLDRFDRRVALACAMLGLVLGTLAGGFALGLTTLLVARVVAGAFGGPATSLSLAVIADSVPPERRGKALGAVMGAFSIASILGVPAGLELARLWGFRAPFFAVAALGAVVTAVAIGFMPPMRGHLERAKESYAGAAPRTAMLNPLAKLSLLNSGLIMLGVFAVVPNLSAFLQHNLGYPREHMGLLYLVGGLFSFVTLRVAGWASDKLGATRVVIVGTALHAVALITMFVHPLPWLPVLAVFSLFMMSGSVRMVPLQALASRVPRPQDRARFMSAQSVVQHLASALGAIAASAVLTADSEGRLSQMDHIALLALGLALFAPLISRRLERGLAARDVAERAAQSAAAAA